MIMILCEKSDSSAQWAADALRTRGLSPIVLSDEDLAEVRGWRHTVGAEGVDCEIRLQGGSRLHGRDVRGVLNRLAFLPRAWSERIGGADRDYALQEMQAFYLSWLHALPRRILNAPTPQGLCGNFRHPSAWTALACRAGLPVRAFKQSCRDDPVGFWERPTEAGGALVIVLGRRVFGPEAVVRRHGAACVRFARDAGCALLGIEFETRAGIEMGEVAGSEAGAGFEPEFGSESERAFGGDWRFRSATLLPDLRPGGDALADALVEEFS